MKPLHLKSFDTLRLTQATEGVLLIQLDRQEVRNALDTVMTRELLEIWRALYVDASPYQVVVLTGAGDKSFCAGADLKERNGISADTWLRQHAVLEQMMLAMLDCPLPLIAAVNGIAFGGGLELLLNCDFAWCSPEARFAFPEPRLGIIPGAMGTQWLPRAVGLARAKEICLTGESFGADEALAWGLVNRILPRDELSSAVLAAAARIRQASPLAIRQVKRALNASIGSDIPGGYRQEIELYRRCIQAPDREEGIAAFNEKRKPEFRKD